MGAGLSRCCPHRGHDSAHLDRPGLNPYSNTMARRPTPDTARYELRADPEQLRTWQGAAANDGRSLAEWIRRACDAAAQKSTRGRKKIASGA